MSARRNSTVAAAVVVGALCAAGCAGSTTASPPQTPLHPSTSSAPSPTSPSPSTPVAPSLQLTAAGPPRPATDDGQAKSAALAAVATYFATLDRLEGPTHQNENEINNVALDPILLVDVKQINSYHEQGWAVKGSTVVASSHLRAANLSYQPKAHPPVLPTVKAAVCLDVSGSHVVDEHGKRVGVANRPNYFTELLTLQNTSAASATPLWRVSDEETTGMPRSCAGQ